jgi:hypothetical protein
MPFQCWLKLPLMSGNGPVSGPVLVERIIAHPFKMVVKGEPLFVVNASNGRFEVQSNMIGGLAAFMTQEGDTLPDNEQFGCMYAEGEDIPYGQPYVIAVPVPQPQVKP